MLGQALLCIFLPAFLLACVWFWTQLKQTHKTRMYDKKSLYLSLDRLDSTNIYQAKRYCVSSCLLSCLPVSGFGLN